MAKAKSASEKKLSLDQTLNAIKKKYGANAVMKASDKPEYARIPTGIVNLDVAIGGGIPMGAMSIISGMESSGKSTVSACTIASAQKRCRECFTEIKITNIDPETGEIDGDELEYSCDCGENEAMRVAYIDAEGTLDKGWTQRFGVNLEAMEYVVPEYAEQAIDITEALVRTGEIDLIIVDSLAVLVPTTEIEASAEDWQVGLHARLMNKFCRVLTAGFNSLGLDNPRKPAVIGINQLREKMVLHGDPITMPGGNGLRFFSSLTLRFRQAGWVTEDGKANGRRIGAEIAFRQIKNKTFPVHMDGTFKIYNESSDKLGVSKGSVNNEEQLIEQALGFGIITGSGWYTYGEEGEPNYLKIQGKDNLVLEVRSRPELFNEIKDKVMVAISNKLA